MNKVYSLDGERVIDREATDAELAEARKTAKERLKKDGADWAMRTCWNCNPAHSHFLQDTKDNFLFSCVMGCGRWYYNGIDITESSSEH